MISTNPADVAASVLEGISYADAAYTRISGGGRLHAAPEYFAAVTIGKRVAQTEGRDVTLEQNINDAIRWSGSHGLEGRVADLSLSGRFDIAVWGPGTDGIQGVVEVKLGTWFTLANVAVAVRSVCVALIRPRGLRWGMSDFHFACWREVVKSGAERMKARICKIVDEATKHAEAEGLTCAQFVAEGEPVEDWNGLIGGSCGGGVLLFERQSG